MKRIVVDSVFPCLKYFTGPILQLLPGFETRLLPSPSETLSMELKKLVLVLLAGLAGKLL
jgi:hypothetical protein